MHPSSLRRRCPPPAASGPAAAAPPSYVAKDSRHASLWPRRGLLRSENEPAADSELMRVFDTPDGHPPRPEGTFAPSVNHPKSYATIKWAGGSRKPPSSRGEDATIRDDLQFGRYFALTAGGYAAAPPQDEYATISFVLKRVCAFWSECTLEGVRFYSFHRVAIDMDRSAGSPGAPALLRVRLLFANFIPRKVIQLQFG